MDSFTIRETFLSFFEERDHRRYPSASLIPNDPTLLLTNAGMVPFKPYFLGDAAPPHPRATSYQKAARTVDIENVGRTTRHFTLFEMLGNFSFGDYFKREAIRWAYELSVGPLGLEPERIWASVYEEDEEAAALWEEETDVPRDRIVAMGVDDNYWWMHVAGPGGPCSELHYDRGPDWGEAGGPAVNDERYLEFYNLVFMQYELDDERNVLGELPSRNVDTGMGLERMAMLKQGVATAYDTDVVRPMVERAEELTGVDYGADGSTDVSLRVLAEHARAASFLIADGVLPAKEGRGYVLRRLVRRAVLNARQLGTDDPVMPAMVDAVIATMSPGYPELEEQRELVTRLAGAEEAEFDATLRKGLGILEEAVAEVEEDEADTLPGDVAFELHDTYGFPIDLTEEIVADSGLDLDRGTFERLMEEQRERARAAQGGDEEGVPVEVYREAAGKVDGARFVGYDTTVGESSVAVLMTRDGVVSEAGEGDEVEVVLPETPFYPEGGGQVGDRGQLETPTGRLEVVDTQEAIEGLVVHRARVVEGEVAEGQTVTARVDAGRRSATARSHSATHVLHATVKDILGGHAQQAGSHVEAGRLRFDFPHFEGVPREKLVAVEELATDRLLADPPVEAEEMSLVEARAQGAIALFGEKYGEHVRVVTIGDFSKELCGGTHVETAARVGGLTIVREESIGANLRRIEALTGADAHRFAVRERMIAEEVARLLNVPTDDLVDRVESLLDRLKEAEREVEKARTASLAQQASEIAGSAERDADGYAFVARRVGEVTPDELRQLALEIRGHLAERAVVTLGTTSADGKAQLVCVVTDDLVGAGVEARPILMPAAQVVGGGAGGKGELAQAGGREGEKLDEALAIAVDEARRAVTAA